MRIDKLLGNMGYGSRKQIKQLMKKKHVTVNAKRVRNGSTHVSPVEDIVKVDEQTVYYKKYIYVMLHKPQGYISATEDDTNKTVLDLLPDYVKTFNPAPVGRLDKNSEGLLLITNDGALNHYLTAPKNAIPKKYEATIEGKVTESDIAAFRNGIKLDDGYRTKSATLEVISSDYQSQVHVTITEGKFHQVKRMFQAIDMRVIYLKRLQMGPLLLDETLKKSSYRELTSEEMTSLKQTHE